MAVILFSPDAQQYGGLSTDTKPTDSGVRSGAWFFERDTGKVWRFYDNDEWQEDLTLMFALQQIIGG